MTRYRNRTPDDIGRNWRQNIIRYAGLDPDGKLVPMSPRRPPNAETDTIARRKSALALHRAIGWTWR